MPGRIWGGLSGRQWAGPAPGAGHCAALPVLSAGKALPVGRPRHASDAFFLRATISTPRSTGTSSSRRSSVPSGRFRKKPCCARTSLANWCSWTARVAAWTRSMSASACGGEPIRSPSPVKRRASTAWRAPRRCSSRHVAPRWPCGTRPYWRCRTAFPASCICMAAPAGWRAFSRPSLIDAGPRSGLDDPPEETAGPARLPLPAVDLSRRWMGGLRKRKSRRRQVCDGFLCSGTRSRA